MEEKPSLSWGQICDKISISSIKAYKENIQDIKNTRIKVELEMPVDIYTDFRKNIEAHRSMRQRRSEDRNEKEMNICVTTTAKR